MEDRGDAGILGIDRELGNRWGASSLERQLIWIDSQFRIGGASVEEGGLKFDGSGTWDTAAGRPGLSVRYDASPHDVGRVMWSSAESAGLSSDWIGEVYKLDAGSVYIEHALADWITIPTSGAPPVATQPGYEVDVDAPGIEIAVFNPTYPSTGEQSKTIVMRDLLTVGTHGLPLIGTGPADYGLRATDVWAWLVENFAEGLKPGRMVVEHPELVIQHLMEPGPMTAGAIANNVNAYHGCAWDVRDFEVNFYPFGEREGAKTWLVRSDDPAYEIDDDGLDCSEAWTGVLVSYTTPTGKARTVGPPGSLAHATHELLEVSDPWHPAVAAGRVRVKSLHLDVPTDENTAIAAGAMWLQEAAARQRKGKVKITGHVWDDHGVPWPAFWVRGGDFIRVVDSDDPSPRRVLETLYDFDSMSLTADLDDTEQRYASFLAHLVNRTTGKA